jgi:hypothetical protein
MAILLLRWTPGILDQRFLVLQTSLNGTLWAKRCDISNFRCHRMKTIHFLADLKRQTCHLALKTDPRDFRSDIPSPPNSHEQHTLGQGNETMVSLRFLSTPPNKIYSNVVNGINSPIWQFCRHGQINQHGWCRTLTWCFLILQTTQVTSVLISNTARMLFLLGLHVQQKRSI